MAANPSIKDSGEWILVPREPTEAMLAAINREFGFSDGYKSTTYYLAPRVWRAMLSASPPSPPAVWSGEDRSAISQSAATRDHSLAATDEEPSGEEFLEFKEALDDLRSLRAEHRALSGGGPGWSARWEAAWAKANDLFANEDEAAHDRHIESFYG